jgi:Flp pilus assembly protein TadD
LFVDVLLENVQYQIEDSEKALELYPNVVFLYITNAYAYFDASQYEKAIDAANGGLEIAIEKPEKIELLSCKASALSKMGKSKSADYQFNKALSLNPYNPDMLNNYAYSLADRGERLSFADSLISKALSSNPNQPGYLDTKAWVLYKMGTYKEAASFAERAVSLDPTSKGFLEHLLAIYDKQGRTEDVAKIRLKLEAIEK